MVRAMPHIHVPHVSTPTLFHGIAWILLTLLVIAAAASFVVLMLGDGSKSPFDRWASWLARQLEDDDGNRIVRAGAEPTSGQKAIAAVTFVITAAAMVWFAVEFLAVD